MAKSRNDVKSVCFFYMFYVITQPYLKILTWNFYTYLFISHCHLTYLPTRSMQVVHIGCPRIIRTYSFSRFSPLRWNRWCCGFQNFHNYSSVVKAKRHTLPKSAYYSVQSLDQVSVGESFFPFCSKTKQATRYWQEAQPRLPQQTHWHDICWRA